MYISDTAITKPVLTVVAMLMIVVFGIVALTQLDTDEYPEIDAPVVVVAVPYPGASPDIVEREVVDPIEEAISGISGIDRMRSSSLDSYGNIVVEFDFSKDPKVATQEIRDKISSIRNDLPTEMEEPILTQFDPADRPIVSLTLSSPGLTGAELTRMADPDITRRLRGISGVATVNLVGSIERELVVEIRPRDLEATGVSVGQLVQALQSQNMAAPVGRLEGSLDGAPRVAVRLQTAGGVADGRARRAAGRPGGCQGFHRRAALLRRLQRRRGGGVRHPQVHRVQHDRRGQRGAREGGGNPA
jgi:HAE1 family hydrophobic/amphiphilic exporter-1